MKKLIFFIAILVCIYNTKAQVFLGDRLTVGIDEKLSDTIPLNLEFSDESHKTIRLIDIVDKPTVLSFVYFDCPSLCSPLQQGISDVIDASDLVIGTDYNVITCSFNYQDSPEKAAEKKENFVKCISKTRCENWHYLTADSANINSLLRSVGYKIKIAGMDFVHPSGIVIISPNGKITRYLYGLSFLPLDFKMAIIESQKGLARPTVNKVLDFCYAYDPAGKRYTLEITKLAATIIIFIALVLLLVLIIKPNKKQSTNV